MVFQGSYDLRRDVDKLKNKTDELAKDYFIQVNSPIITYLNGTYTPSSVSATAYESSREITDLYEGILVLEESTDGGINYTFKKSVEGHTISHLINDTTITNYRVTLYDTDNNYLDSQTITVVRTTRGGTGKGYDFAYYTTATAPSSAPSGDVTKLTGDYDEWLQRPKDVDATHTSIYMSFRTSEDDEWGSWSEPVKYSAVGERGEDGEGLEMIFCRTTTAGGYSLDPSTLDAVSTDDYVPTGWTDDQKGVNSTYQYEYVCMRTKEKPTGSKISQWGKFTSPKLWATYSEDGEDAINVILGNEAQLIPIDTNGNLKENEINIQIPVYCYKGISRVAGTISISGVSNKFSTKTINQQPDASHDGLVTLKCTSVPNQITGKEPIAVTVEGKTFTKYFIWNKIGDGQDGNEGGTYDYVYYTTDSTNLPNISTGTTINPNTNRDQVYTWCARPTNVTSTYPYCYGAYIKMVEGEPVGNYSDVYVWAKFGKDGGQGTAGKSITRVVNYYLATSYSSGVSTSDGAWGTWSTSIQSMDATKQYLWNYEKCYTGNSENDIVSTTSPCIIGRYGQNGKGITSITEEYRLSTGTNASTMIGSWVTTPPVMTPTNKYLWNRETIAYTSGDPTTTTPTIIGAYGETGQSVTDVINYYVATDSGTTTPTTSANWKTSVSQLNPPFSSTNKYLWNKEETYSGTNKIGDTSPVVISYWSEDGSPGKGITGITEEYRLSTGTNSSTMVGSWSSTPPAMSVTNKYLWNRETITFTEGNPVTTTAKIIGAYGDTGPTGSRGTGAVNVTTAPTSYTTTTGGFTPAYRMSLSTAKSESGLSEILVGDYIRHSYFIYPIGYIDNDYVYTSARISVRGSTGAGITEVVNYYAVTTTNTTQPSDNDWQTTVPSNFNETNKYLWNKEVSKSGTTVVSTTDPTIISYWAKDGNEGKGISSITEEYRLSTGTDSSTMVGSWSSSPPAMTVTNKYLWNRETINYTKGDPVTTSAKIIGVYGDTGPTGKGISNVVNEYAVSSSTTAPTTGWSTSITTSNFNATNKYLWNREKITYTNPSSTQYTTAVIIGEYGKVGENVSSVTEKYGLSSDKNTQPTNWYDTPQEIDNTNRYLWNYEIINYSKPSTSYNTTPKIIGVYGDTGDDGRSVGSVINEYAVSTSNTTAPTSNWKTSVSELQNSFNATNKYLWNREVVKDDENIVINRTDASVIGEYGKVGENVESVTEKYATSTLVSSQPTTWYNEVQPLSATNKYLWNYEIIKYSKPSITYETTPHIIGVYGDQGVKGDKGMGVLTYTHDLTTYTTRTGGFTPSYRITLSQLKSDAGVTTVQVGDFVKKDTDLYRVGYVDSTYAYLDVKEPLDGEDGADGIGLEMIFFQTNVLNGYGSSNPANWDAVQEDDYYGQDKTGNQWTDNPHGVSSTSIYEYVCKRMKRPDNDGNGQWGKFTSPTLWATYQEGIPGVDGEGEQFIFILTTTETIPTLPTAENQIVKPSNQFITVTGTISSGSWSKGGKTYTKRMAKSIIPSGVTPAVGDYVSKDSTIYYIGYIETSYVYLIQLSIVWFDDPQTVDVTHPYQYISSRKYDTSTETWSSWSEPSLWNKYTSDGSQGPKGGDGRDGRDGSDISGDEIMQKLSGQKINATTIGEFGINDLMTTKLSNDTGEIADTNGHGFYRLMKMGRLCLLTVNIYQFKFTSIGGHKTVFSIPTWGYPMTTMFMNSAPNMETISLTSGGNFRVQSNNHTVNETVELSGVFVYFAQENVTLASTTTTINESSVMSSYPVTATLKDSSNTVLSGKSIEFEVNGGTYTRKTDNNGIAKLDLNIGNGSTYSITARFKGDTGYAQSDASKNVSVTPCTNPVITFNPTSKYAVVENNMNNATTPIRGLSCKVEFNNDTTYMTTDAKGRLDFNSILSQYSGNVFVKVTTNDAYRCNSKSANYTLSGGKTSETLTVASTPSEINSLTNGRIWEGITVENLNSPWDGKYAKAYNIASGTNYASLDMLCNFDIPHTATINKIKVTLVYASLLGQTNLSKGNFPAPSISLTHTNNSQIISTVSIGQAISRTECGNWYVADKEWTLNSTDGANTNGKWDKIGIRLNSATNGGGGYGNNASYGVDYLLMEVTYTT